MRIRTIKPEFWKDEKISRMKYFTRLLFIGLWNYVDDNGVGLDDEALIAGELFARDFYEHPDAIRMSIHGGLSELSLNAQVVRYWDGEHHVLFISHWDEHQRINRPSTSGLKRPEEVPENVVAPTEQTLFTEGSVNTHGVLSEDSLTEQGTGNREGNREQGAREAPREPRGGMSELDSYSTSFEQFWAVYPWQCDKPDAYREYRRATRKTSATIIIAAAGNYAAAQGKPGAPYTSKPATWLRNEGWLNKPQPRKTQAATRTQRAHDEWAEDRRIHDQLAAEERMAQHAVTN